jgi:hypothetical protein
MSALKGGRQKATGSSKDKEPVKENVPEQVKLEELNMETNEATAKRGCNENLEDAKPPRKQNKFVDSYISDMESEDRQEYSGCRDSDSKSSCSNDANNNSTRGTDDYMCNFETQRFQQDPQELI